jgi:uncharacterized membrane protein YbaN (DUF454 family)
MEPRPARRPRPHLPPLPLWIRGLLWVVGWLFLLLGVAGLFLPVLQGGLFLVIGAAIISLVSRRVHQWLRSSFGNWPRAWKRVERFRRWLHGKLHRR